MSNLFDGQQPETPTETPKGPRIEFVNITNIGPIESAQIDYTQSDLVVVVGKNGSGKSTAALVLEAIQGRFDTKALKSGADKGAFEVNFSYGGQNFTCKLTLTRFTSGEESKVEPFLQFVDANQKPISQQRAKELVKYLVGDSPDFDINTFITTTAPARRGEMLQKLSGVDLAPLTKAVKEAETARTEANRDVTNQQARALPFNADLAAKEPVSASDLTAQRDAITKHNDMYERSKAKREEFAKDADQSATIQHHEADKALTIRLYEDELARLKAKHEEDLKRIDAKIEEAKAIESEAKERLTKADEWLSNPENQPKGTAEIDQQLNDLTTTNAAIADAKRLKKEADELDRLKVVAEEKAWAVEVARNAKMNAIKAAKLPAGLQFDPNDETGLLLNGQPIERASSAELTIAAIMVAVELCKGALHWIHVDCKALDFENFKIVKEFLAKMGWQALLEKPAQNEGELSLQFYVV